MCFHLRLVPNSILLGLATRTLLRGASKDTPEGSASKSCASHDLRGSHETALLDAGVPIHVVAARCGHDPATLLRNYAKRTDRADKSAAAVIGSLSKGILG